MKTVLFIACVMLLTSCMSTTNGFKTAQKQMISHQACAYPIVLWPTENGKALEDSVIINHINRHCRD